MSWPYKVLFLCTGNSARSLMAEALVNAHGGKRWHAYSAGSRPTGTPNPFALEKIRALGQPEAEYRSKSWDEFALPGAPVMDIVITVCDSAAGESCPLWPGDPVKAHWSFPDPAAVEGSEAQKRAAFDAVYRHIQNRVDRMIALPWNVLDDYARGAALRSIGAVEPH